MGATAFERHHRDSDALCRYVREVSGDTVIVSFSRGKDAIAALHQCRRYWSRVVPFFLGVIPGLRFEEEDLKRWEDVLGAEVYRYAHPSLFRMLRARVYQTPARDRLIDTLDLPSANAYSYTTIEEDVRRRAGVPDAFIAIGTRSADSLARRTNMIRTGTLNPARRSFFAVFDWKADDVERAIRELGQPLPIDYRIFGRSFDGIDARFMLPMREHLPDDFARVLRWFPLADLDLHRRTLRQEKTR